MGGKHKLGVWEDIPFSPVVGNSRRVISLIIATHTSNVAIINVCYMFNGYVMSPVAEPRLI